MKPDISVIIPVYNGQDTLADCLHSVCSSSQCNFELIVVDDGSNDDTLDIINQFPCRLIQIKHQGASAARNAGARASQSDILFFTDADCVLSENTLSSALSAIQRQGMNSIIGGSYNEISFDQGFFSDFQAVFVNYSETKKADMPDYIATHAMAISRDKFLSAGGFRENWLPILEDVEFSHRLRRAGSVLIIDKNILVKHIFNFSFLKSAANAIKKSCYWTYYSLKNNDLLIDSGTASYELKLNVIFFYLILVSAFYAVITANSLLAILAATFLILNLYFSKFLLSRFYKSRGYGFFICASIYYLFIYPVPVSIGGLLGLSKFILQPATDQAT